MVKGGGGDAIAKLLVLQHYLNCLQCCICTAASKMPYKRDILRIDSCDARPFCSAQF